MRLQSSGCPCPTTAASASQQMQGGGSWQGELEQRGPRARSSATRRTRLRSLTLAGGLPMVLKMAAATETPVWLTDLSADKQAGSLLCYCCCCWSNLKDTYNLYRCRAPPSASSVWRRACLHLRGKDLQCQRWAERLTLLVFLTICYCLNILPKGFWVDSDMFRKSSLSPLPQILSED